jgi:hypothetical protein
MSALLLRLLLVVSTMLPASVIAFAQCSVETVVIKGRVENSTAHSKVRVQLLYAKDKPGESGEVGVEEGAFQIPIEFAPLRSSIFTNLPKKCDRKPKTVVITLLENDQESDQVSLDFAKGSRWQIRVLTLCAPK